MGSRIITLRKLEGLFRVCSNYNCEDPSPDLSSDSWEYLKCDKFIYARSYDGDKIDLCLNSLFKSETYKGWLNIRGKQLLLSSTSFGSQPTKKGKIGSEPLDSIILRSCLLMNAFKDKKITHIAKAYCDEQNTGGIVFFNGKPRGEHNEISIPEIRDLKIEIID